MCIRDSYKTTVRHGDGFNFFTQSLKFGIGVKLFWRAGLVKRAGDLQSKSPVVIASSLADGLFGLCVEPRRKHHYCK